MEKRIKDLTEVFDERWKANHNNDLKNNKEKEKIFMDKMFNVNHGQNKSNSITPNSVEDTVKRLNDNIESNSKIQREVKVNNFTNKFRN